MLSSLKVRVITDSMNKVMASFNPGKLSAKTTFDQWECIGVSNVGIKNTGKECWKKKQTIPKFDFDRVDKHVNAKGTQAW